MRQLLDRLVTLPFAEQACILEVHYKNAATFHYSHSSLTALLHTLQVLPVKMYKTSSSEQRYKEIICENGDRQQLDDVQGY